MAAGGSRPGDCRDAAEPGGLELRMTPVEAGLGRLWGMLLLWLGIGVAGLVAASSAAGLSAAGGLFHSTGPEVERPTPQGHVPE